MIGMVYDEVVFGLENLFFLFEVVWIRIEEVLCRVGLWECCWENFDYFFGGGW